MCGRSYAFPANRARVSFPFLLPLFRLAGGCCRVRALRVSGLSGSIPFLFAGGQGVEHEHADGHGAHAAGHGRDVAEACLITF